MALRTSSSSHPSACGRRFHGELVTATSGSNSSAALSARPTHSSLPSSQPLKPSYVRTLLPRLATKVTIDKRVHPHGLVHNSRLRVDDGRSSSACYPSATRALVPRYHRPISSSHRSEGRGGGDATSGVERIAWLPPSPWRFLRCQVPPRPICNAPKPMPKHASFRADTTNLRAV